MVLAEAWSATNPFLEPAATHFDTHVISPRHTNQHVRCRHQLVEPRALFYPLPRRSSAPQHPWRRRSRRVGQPGETLCRRPPPAAVGDRPQGCAGDRISRSCRLGSVLADLGYGPRVDPEVAGRGLPGGLAGACRLGAVDHTARRRRIKPRPDPESTARAVGCAPRSSRSKLGLVQTRGQGRKGGGRRGPTGSTSVSRTWSTVSPLSCLRDGRSITMRLGGPRGTEARMALLSIGVPAQVDPWHRALL